MQDIKNLILSEDAYDFLIYRQNTIFDTLTEEERFEITITNDLKVIYINNQNIPLLNYENYDYTQIPQIFTTLSMPPDPEALLYSGITALSDSPLSLTGRGVLIGYVDTGIQYERAAFRFPDGSTRIAAIWDQSVQSGTPPDGFYYGSEYTREQINLALQSDTPGKIVMHTDFSRHGTDMAGVLAAKDATIAMVKLKEAKQYLREFYAVSKDALIYEETDIMLGMKYLVELSVKLSMPLVIVLGLGTNMGNHTGKTLLSGLIDAYVSAGSCAVVVAGGNEGSARHHYFQKIDSAEEEPFVKDTIEINVAKEDSQFMVELWGNRPELFSISVRTPFQEIVTPALIKQQGSFTYELLFHNTVIYVDYVVGEPVSGGQLVMLRVKNAIEGIWEIDIVTENLNVLKEARSDIRGLHAWLPVTGMISEGTYFLKPEPDVTLCEPACSRQCLAVTAYNMQTGGTAIFSSRGFNADGAIKPDLCAPGVNIKTETGIRSGSSMSAAILGGGVAQYLEWAIVRKNEIPFRMPRLKYYLYRGAQRNNSLNYPNQKEGYGKLNMMDAFEQIAGTTRFP